MAQILDSAGVPYYLDQPTSGLFASINVRHTAADATGSFIWAMRNPLASGKSVILRAVRGAMWFDGIAAAGGNISYEFCWFTGGDPTTGTTIPRSRKRRTSYASYLADAASVILDANIQQKSGILTITGITGIEVFHTIRMGISVTGDIRPLDLDFVVSGAKMEVPVLGAGDGFGIRLGGAAVIGQGLAGSVEWDER